MCAVACGLQKLYDDATERWLRALLHLLLLLAVSCCHWRLRGRRWSSGSRPSGLGFEFLVGAARFMLLLRRRRLLLLLLLPPPLLLLLLLPMLLRILITMFLSHPVALFLPELLLRFFNDYAAAAAKAAAAN